jgi:3-methyladenine DNA glycosylase AlkD
MGLKIFKKHKSLVFKYVKNLLKSDNPYAVRFAIVTMLAYFLGEDFNDEVLDLAKGACCNNYYVNMAIAWLYSVALVKNYNQTIKYIENKNLPKFVHNKSIQKAKESYRITADIKNYLNSLKI